MFNLRSIGTTDCSMPGQNAPTCSAWTYLRKDLPPIVYSFPSSPAGSDAMKFWYPNVGIIVDPNVVWPLITTMNVVDSGTDARNCGSFDPSYINPIFDKNNGYGRCNPIVYDKKGDKVKNQDDYCIYISDCKQTPCNPSCSYNIDIQDENCRIENSGGSVSTLQWYESNYPGYDWDCPNTKSKSNGWNIREIPNGIPDCYKAVEINKNDICKNDMKNIQEVYGNQCTNFARYERTTDCYVTKPAVLSTIDTPDYSDTGILIADKDGYWKTNLEISNKNRNLYYIGTDINKNETGATFSEQTWKNCNINNNGIAGKCLVSNNAITTNGFIIGKFLKEDWGRWISEIKLMWKHIYNTLDEYSGYKNFNLPLDGYSSMGYPNYIYGNACNSYDWWENEVNLYVNPTLANDENSNLNVLYRKSILGFLYLENTTEDFTKVLPTGVKYSEKCHFKNSIERAVGYLCNYNVNHNDPISTKCTNNLNNVSNTTYKDVRNEEIIRQQKAKDLVLKIVNKFNNKYRNNNDKIKAYKLYNYTNAFQSWECLYKTFNNLNKFEEIFIEY